MPNLPSLHPKLNPLKQTATQTASAQSMSNSFNVNTQQPSLQGSQIINPPNNQQLNNLNILNPNQIPNINYQYQPSYPFPMAAQPTNINNNNINNYLQNQYQQQPSYYMPYNYYVNPQQIHNNNQQINNGYNYNSNQLLYQNQLYNQQQSQQTNNTSTSIIPSQQAYTHNANAHNVQQPTNYSSSLVSTSSQLPQTNGTVSNKKSVTGVGGDHTNHPPNNNISKTQQNTPTVPISNDCANEENVNKNIQQNINDINGPINRMKSDVSLTRGKAKEQPMINNKIDQRETRLIENSNDNKSTKISQQQQNTDPCVPNIHDQIKPRNDQIVSASIVTGNTIKTNNDNNGNIPKITTSKEHTKQYKQVVTSTPQYQPVKVCNKYENVNGNQKLNSNGGQQNNNGLKMEVFFYVF